ncbi:MAG: helix-turn-helix transcriptional regulator [Anaerolineaceae bacterium]
MDDKLAVLRMKKIGLFMRQLRENKAKSIDDCSFWLNIPLEEYQAMEEGKLSPTLPQLESLAYFLQCPFDEFLSGPVPEPEKTRAISRDINLNLLNLRNHVITALLKQKRQQKEFSIDQLAELTNIPTDKLVAYENGIELISLTNLEILVKALGLSLEDFFSISGPLIHSPSQKPASSPSLEDLPTEIQEFINQPINRPYLELAMRLSQMEADKLRSIASSLLEITY